MRGEEGGGGVCQGALKSQSSVAVKDYREGCERSEHSASLDKEHNEHCTTFKTRNSNVFFVVFSS